MRGDRSLLLGALHESRSTGSLLTMTGQGIEITHRHSRLPRRLDQFRPRSAQALVHVDHEGHAEQRRRQVDDRDRHERRDENPAVKTVAALSLRIALASAGQRNRIAASPKYSRPSSQAVAMKNTIKPTPAEHEGQRDQ